MPAPDYASEIANLEAAAASGELRIEQDGEMVYFATASDLLQRLNYFKNLAAQAGKPASQLGQYGFSAVGFCRE